MHLEQECNTIPWADLGPRHHKLESRALSLSHPMQSLNKNEAPKEKCPQTYLAAMSGRIV